MDIESILEQLLAIAEANIDDFYAHDPKTGKRTHIDLTRVSREKMAAVAEISEEVVVEVKDGVEIEHRTTKIKLGPRVAALDLICKHLGIFEPRLEVANGRLVQQGIEIVDAPKRKN